MNPETAYMHGALHDGYVYVGKSKGKVAVITQKNREWLERIRGILKELEASAWIFQQRDLSVLETKFPELLKSITVPALDDKSALAYVAGFFDAEGGIPRDPEQAGLLYIQFVQKNPRELKEIITVLKRFGVKCGRLHQYDKKKSGCWRFFVKAESHRRFIEIIKSRHPEKQERLAIFKKRLLKRQTR